MFVKTKPCGEQTLFFLCIGEQGGAAPRSWKTVEYSLCLGETLALSSDEWIDILGNSREFHSIPLDDVLRVVERYAAERGLDRSVLAGLREAARAPRRKPRRSGQSERRSQEDEYSTALRLLGLPPGSSNEDVEAAFRKAARRHHPDVGGDATRFRALVDARNLLLTREPRARKTM